MNPEFLAKLKQKVAKETFSKKTVDHALLYELLDVTNHAPSRFNLQPWHFIVVNNESLKKLLFHIALDQPQILEAPTTVVMVADPDAWRLPFQEVLRLSVESGALSERRAKSYRRSINSFFETGPLGIRGLAKRMTLPFRKLKKPTPQFVSTSSQMKEYVKSQTMFAAGTFLVAARMAGLTVATIQSFDEFRLKKLLNIPKKMSVPLIMPLGYTLEIDSEMVKEVRMPIEDKACVDFFGNTVRINSKRS